MSVKCKKTKKERELEADIIVIGAEQRVVY